MKYQAGDIYLVDSDHFGAKMVKMLMTAPTLWQYLWRKLPWFTQNEVRFYHVGMCIGDDKVIEQQSVVEYEDVFDAITKKKSYIVWRRKGLTDEDRANLVEIAKADLGEKYDWLLIIGSTLTWLTGIPLFRRYIQLRDMEFCVTRVAYWYYRRFLEKFGQSIWHMVTTDHMDDYFPTKLDEWEKVDAKC